ncbi:hypothetical protein Gotur_018999, partial [Gossypium turneri]
NAGCLGQDSTWDSTEQNIDIFGAFNDCISLLSAYAFNYNLKGWPSWESPDLRLFSTPQSISSLNMPFLVSGCLGIHRKPFLVLSWNPILTKDSCGSGGSYYRRTRNDRELSLLDSLVKSL